MACATLLDLFYQDIREVEPAPWCGRVALYGDEATPTTAVLPFQRTVAVPANAAASFEQGGLNGAIAQLTALLGVEGGVDTLYLVSVFVSWCVDVWCVFVLM